MNTLGSRFLLATAILFVPLGAQAQYDWYMKGNLGMTSADAAVDSDFFTGGYNVDDEAFSWALGAGMKLNEYISLELAYSDYNEFSESYSFSATDPTTPDAYTVSGRSKAEIDAVIFSGVARIPLSDQWTVYGRVGVARWALDLRDNFGTDEGGPGSGAIRVSDTGYEVAFGFGALMALSDYASLGVEYETMDIDSSPSSLDIEVELNTLSAVLELRL